MGYKEVFKQLNLIEENAFWDNYCCLIDENLNNDASDITQKHHIIPKCAFSYAKIPVDNSTENIINLSLSNHIKAHYYLANCATGKFKYGMQSALRFLSKNLPYNELISLLPDFEQQYIEYNKAISKKMMGHTVSKHVREAVSKSRKGQAPWNKGLDKTDKRIAAQAAACSQTKKNHPISRHHSEETKNKIRLGNLGRTVSEETRHKLSEINKGKKQDAKTCKKHSEFASQARWLNNGVQERFVGIDKLDSFISDGWVFGRLKHK